MTQLSLLDGVAAKLRGMDRASGNNAEFLDRIRLVAVQLALKNCYVTVDDLRAAAKRLRIKPAHPNAWGCVFEPRHWKATGRERSKWPSNHARWVTIWRLK